MNIQEMIDALEKLNTSLERGLIGSHLDARTVRFLRHDIAVVKNGLLRAQGSPTAADQEQAMNHAQERIDKIKKILG